MSTKIITQPAEEPVTLDDAKLQLRIDGDLENALISRYLKAARQRCEREINRAFVSTTRELRLEGFPPFYDQWGNPISSPYCDPRALERGLSGFPSYGAIRLAYPALISVSSIQYIDTAGVTQVLDPSQYEVEDGTPGRVVPAYGRSWPATRRKINAVVIRYVSGYGPAEDVPESLKIAILLLCTQLYENRGEEPAELSTAIRYFLDSEDWGGGYG